MKYLDAQNNAKLFNLCGHDTFRNMKIHHDRRFEALKPWIKDGIKILDIGCGSSVFFLLLKEFNSTIIPYGIDREKDAISVSQEIFPEYKDNFIYDDMINIRNITYDIDISMISAELLSSESYYFIFDWMFEHGNAFIYQHGVKNPFDDLRSIMINYNYNSLLLSNNVVKIVSKIDRKNILPSFSIQELQKIFLISQYTSNYDFNNLNNMWNKFYKDDYQYYEIKKDGFFAIIAAQGDAIKDVFVIKLGNLI